MAAGLGFRDVLSNLGFCRDDQQDAVMQLLGLIIPAKQSSLLDSTFASTPEALAGLNQLMQTHVKRNPKGAAGLGQSGWVEAFGESGAGMERAGFKDKDTLKGHHAAITDVGRALGLVSAILPQSVPPSANVICLGGQDDRVCQRMDFLAEHFKAFSPERIYFFGAATRDLFPGIEADIIRLLTVGTAGVAHKEIDAMRYRAKERGFDPLKVEGTEPGVSGARATVAEHAVAFLGKSGWAAQEPSPPIFVVSNAPYSRRQALDVLKTIYGKTGKIPTVIPVGPAFRCDSSQLYNIIEELTFVVNTVCDLLKLAQTRGQEASVKHAIAELMNYGVGSHSAPSVVSTTGTMPGHSPVGGESAAASEASAPHPASWL